MAKTAAEKRAERAAKRAAAKAEKDAMTATEELNRDATIHPDQVASAHGETARPSSAGAKVIVACKLGIAFFQLQLCREEEVDEQTQTGVRRVKKWTRTGQIVRIRGTAYPRGTPPEGYPERPFMVDGAALNFGIDKDFWDQWVEQNRLNPVVVNKMIFAHENRAMVEGLAREQKGVLSGLEPINPKNDKRMPKSSRPDVSDVETEETKAAKMERAISGTLTPRSGS